MHRFVRHVSLFAALLALPRVAPAQDALADGRRALDRIDAIFSPAMTYRIRMTTFKNEAEDKMYVMRIAKLDKRLRVEFDEPAIEKGRRMLNDGDALWMYLARTSKLVRLANRQAFMGSDASNQDLLRVSLADDYDLTATTKDTVRGEVLLVLELKAKESSAAYDRIRVYVHPTTFFPSSEEFVTLSGKLLKRMTFSEPRMVGGIPFPTHVVITNELLKNSRTVLDYSDVNRAANLTPSFFTQAALRR